MTDSNRYRTANRKWTLTADTRVARMQSLLRDQGVSDSLVTGGAWTSVTVFGDRGQAPEWMRAIAAIFDEDGTRYDLHRGD